MQKVKQTLTATVLAVVLAIFAILCIVVPHSVKAEVDSAKPLSGHQKAYTVLITNLENYYYLYEVDDVIPLNYDTYGDTLYQMVRSGEILARCSGYNVIIDIRTRVKDLSGEYRMNLTQAAILLNCMTRLCRELSQSGSGIMVVSDILEERMREQPDATAFLDYVDIYVNLDVFTLFFNNYMEKVGEAVLKCFSENVGSLELIIPLDEILSQEWFAGYYLPLLESYIACLIGYPNQNLNITYVIPQDMENVWYMLYNDYNLLKYGYYMYDDFACRGSGSVCAMPICYDDTTLEEIIAFAGDYASDEVIPYVYLSRQYYNGEAYYGDGDGAEYPEDMLYQISYDFMYGNDLSVYDNIDGRCVVTLMPIGYGPNGWMKTGLVGGINWIIESAAVDAAFPFMD